MRGCSLLFLALFLWTSAAAAEVCTHSDMCSPIRVGVEQNDPPFVFTQANGQVSGLSIDILNQLSQQTALHIMFMPAAPLVNLLSQVQAHQVDLLTSVHPTPEQLTYLEFSTPYVQVPAVLLVAQRQEGHHVNDFYGRPIGVSQNTKVAVWARTHYPRVRWASFPSDEAAFSALNQGRIAAMVLDLASAHWLLRQTPSSAHIAATLNFSYPLSFAWRHDQPEVGHALSAALNTLPPDDRKRVIYRWISDTPLHGANHTLHFIALLLIVVGGLMIVGSMRCKPLPSPLAHAHDD